MPFLKFIKGIFMPTTARVEAEELAADLALKQKRSEAARKAAATRKANAAKKAKAAKKTPRKKAKRLPKKTKK